MNKNEIAERIYQSLFGQRFYDWYNGDFEKHLTCEIPNKTKEEILKDIASIFHLK